MSIIIKNRDIVYHQKSSTVPMVTDSFSLSCQASWDTPREEAPSTWPTF